MKEFAQSAIDGTQEYFRTQSFPIEQRTIGDLGVTYFVLPQGLEPNLPDFALRMTRTDPATGVAKGIFGVSDSVPAELRPYWVAHEVVEFTQIGISQRGRCRLAEEKVLELVPAPLRGSYATRRSTFFTNLSDYFKQDLEANTGNYTREDLGEAQETLKYLNTLQQPATSPYKPAPDCRHHYLIEPPHGAESLAICKHCLGKRSFKNGAQDTFTGSGPKKRAVENPESETPEK